jgi:predicted acyltransferase
LLALALCYWLIDVRNLKRGTLFFIIVGMNPLFIYLFANTGGAELFHRIAKPFTMALFAWAGQLPALIATSLVVWGMLWYLCWWLYKKQIFFRI